MKEDMDKVKKETMFKSKNRANGRKSVSSCVLDEVTYTILW